jgi:hypothetical protein
MLSTSHDRVRLRAGFGPAGAPDWVLSDRVAYGKPGGWGPYWSSQHQPSPPVAAEQRGNSGPRTGHDRADSGERDQAQLSTAEEGERPQLSVACRVRR